MRDEGLREVKKKKEKGKAVKECQRGDGQKSKEYRGKGK